MVYGLILVVLLAALTGCTEPVKLNAFVDPPRGQVPYAARIVCSSLPGMYTYELPDGTAITSKESEFDVIVDRLEWEATVTWTDGHQVRVENVRAEGTNTLPVILLPRINGDAYLWTLRSDEQTLIDFTYHPSGLSGPESGVVYGGSWRIVEIRVEPKLKSVCDAPMGDSIFCPPWEAGEFHALFRGQVWENACLVYPLYTAEIAPNGLPYAPEALSGYSVDVARTRNVLVGVQFPEQMATIRVVVEDDWGRRTSASFDIRVAASTSWDAGANPGSGVHPGTPEDPTLFKNAAFFVSSRTDSLYYRRDCPEVCGIPDTERIYFLSAENAEAAGKHRSPSCFGY
jgi:hypothetical protein